MPVTFGAVQVVPTATPTAKAAPPVAPPATQPPPVPDARDLGPALRHLDERAARVRAH